MLEAMAGIGLPGTQSPDLDMVKLRQAASLASQVDGPERLTLFLAEAFKVRVQLKEFVAAWITIPAALQTRLADDWTDPAAQVAQRRWSPRATLMFAGAVSLALWSVIGLATTAALR